MSIVGIALAALGAAIAFDAFGAGRAPEAIGPAARRSTAAADPVDVLTPLAEPNAVAGEVRAEVEAPAEDAAEAQAATPAQRCAVYGVVVDGRGLALGGVRIRIQRWHADPDSDDAASTESGADGRFRLELDLPPNELERRMRAVVEHAGYTRLDREVVLAPGEQDLGPLALADAGDVEGLVLDARGAPIADLQVVALPASATQQLSDVSGPYDSHGRTTSKADGRFALKGLPVGSHVIGSGGDGWAWSYVRDVEVRARGVQRAVVLRLERLPDERSIELVVLTPSGEPVPGALIQSTYTSDAQSGSGSSSADEQGRYTHRLQVLVPHTFTASDLDERFGSASARDVAPGTRGLELRLTERRTLELLVRSSDGRPVETYRAHASNLDRNSQRIASAEAKGEADGRAELVVPAEPFKLDVDAEGFAKPELEPFDPRTVPSSLEIVLQPLPGVAGIVLRDGEPVGGARVKLIRSQVGREYFVNGFPVRSEPWADKETRSGEDGRFSLTLRESGDWFVRAEVEGLAPAEIGPLSIDAVQGARELELALGPGGAIEGRVKARPGESPAGAIVGLSRGDGFGVTRRVGADGSYRFERLTPGRWLLKRCRADILPDSTTSTMSGKSAAELPWSCEVVEGQVTRFDLDLSALASVILDGSLTVAGAPAAGWSAALRSAAEFREPESEVALDARGRFRAELEASGSYSLTLSPPTQQSALSIEARLELAPGSNRFERDLRLGAVAGSIGTIPSNGTRIRYTWSQDELSCNGFLDPDPQGTYRVDPIPAGEIVFFRRDEAGGPWSEIARAVVPAGGEARADLP